MKNAFVDASGLLRGWGYIETAGEGLTALPVADEFTLDPSRWRWDGSAWLAVTKPAEPNPRQFAKQLLSRIPLATSRQEKAGQLALLLQLAALQEWASIEAWLGAGSPPTAFTSQEVVDIQQASAESGLPIDWARGRP